MFSDDKMNITCDMCLQMSGSDEGRVPLYWYTLIQRYQGNSEDTQHICSPKCLSGMSSYNPPEVS